LETYNPYASRDSVYLVDVGAHLVPLEDLLARTDVVSCHLPVTPTTIGALDASCFCLMKSTACFINTPRGELVNAADLSEALRAGKLAGAALDVRSKESASVATLESLQNVILVPHIGALTHEAQQRVTISICDDIARLLDGQ
jgi:D-3-phosphoglycerate dehydrogenase